MGQSCTEGAVVTCFSPRSRPGHPVHNITFLFSAHNIFLCLTFVYPGHSDNQTLSDQRVSPKRLHNYAKTIAYNATFADTACCRQIQNCDNSGPLKISFKLPFSRKFTMIELEFYIIMYHCHSKQQLKATLISQHYC